MILELHQVHLHVILLKMVESGLKIEIDLRKRIELEGAELEEYIRIQGEKHNRLIIKRYG